MTRNADPKSKTLILTVRAKPEWESEFRAFKEICARNDIEYGREIYQRAVQSFLRDHNWPPGNSQTLLESFPIVQAEEPILCAWCSNEAEYEIEYVPSGQVYPVCSEHFEASRGEKKWKERKR